MKHHKIKNKSVPLQPEAKPPERAETKSTDNEVAKLNIKHYDDLSKLVFAGMVIAQMQGKPNLFIVTLGGLLSILLHWMAIGIIKDKNISS